jgi:hypothetical protein
MTAMVMAAGTATAATEPERDAGSDARSPKRNPPRRVSFFVAGVDQGRNTDSPPI